VTFDRAGGVFRDFVRNSRDAEIQAKMVQGKSEFVDISASGNGDEACFIKCSRGSERVGKVGERDGRVIGEGF
jgi:hypothetical protein